VATFLAEENVVGGLELRKVLVCAEVDVELAASIRVLELARFAALDVVITSLTLVVFVNTHVHVVLALAVLPSEFLGPPVGLVALCALLVAVHSSGGETLHTFVSVFTRLAKGKGI